MVHALLVRVVVKDPAFVTECAERFAELHWHSNNNEPGTLTYEMQRPASAPDASPEEKSRAARTILILERYTGLSALTEVHNHSQPFKHFGAWLSGHVGTEVESVAFEHYDSIDVPKHVPVEATAANAPTAAPAKTDGILVFCGARTGASPSYVHDANRVGELIVELGRPLVYGGGTVGVMGAVARTVQERGGKVIGVIPDALAPREASGDLIGEVSIVKTMAARKDLMFSQANWLVCLPGGVGTLDELFEVITLCQLNAYRCRIGLLSTENFYGPLMAMLRHLVAQGFLEADTVDALVVRETPDELFAAMAAAPDLQAVGGACNLRWN